MVRYFRWTVLIIFCLTAYWILQPRKKVARETTLKKKFDPGNGVGLYLPQTSSEHFSKLAFEAIHPATNDEYYYTEKQSQVLKFAVEKRYVKVSGFQFCSMLDASSFDALVPIRDLGGSLAATNPDLNEFINLIDGRAYDIFQGMMRKFHLAHQKEARRLACYTAAEGQTAAANLTFTRLLNEINPKNYFKHIISSIVPSRATTLKRKYKLAYLIMVHEIHGFDQLCNLLTTVDDGEAIILIHVDARVQSNELYYKLKTWTEKRLATNPESAIYLAKQRFSNIWGHISLVYTQLSGFWELLDLADWDYVINLSNYDYPLKSNAEIHATLSKKGTNKNYIEYWSETSDLAERLIRPVLGEADYSTVYHPPELGLISRPYTNWISWKHHQWVILTPETIQFLRNDIRALNYLAFAEHTYIPDESYFGTVLLNVPEFQNTIVNDNKRYLRFTGGAHPSWLGYKDRHLFPSGESDPSFYFIRKLNSKGDMFQEQALLKWIKEEHFNKFDTISKRKCNVHMISVQSSCLKELADDIAYKNSMIVIPVNTPYMPIAKNLVCSLSRLGIKNVMYWALDLDVYETLIDEGKLAILMPGLNPMNEFQHSKAGTLQKVLRSKPKLVEMFIKAGLSVWVMDADMVALRDFRDIKDPQTNVFISYDSTDHLIGGVPIPSSSLMYFRNSNHSLTFLEKIKSELAVSAKLDDEEAMRRVITKQQGVEVLTSDHTRMYGRDVTEEKPTETSSGPVTIRYLDGLRFMSSKIFIDNPSFIPKGFEEFYTLHLHGKNVEPVFKKHSLWFLDQDGNCDMDSADPRPKFK